MTQDAEIAAGATAPAVEVVETEISPAEVDAEKPEGEKPKVLTEAEELEKLRKAKSKDDRRIGKLTAIKYQAQQEAEELRQRLAKYESKTDQKGPPKESDFEGRPYSEYLDALTDYKVEQKLNESKAKDTESRTKDAAEEWEAERAEHIDENHKEAQKAFPDFKDVMDSVAEENGMIPLSKDLRKALLEADNGAYALYALAKEGLLDEANTLSPYKAGMLVARMEDKGLALSKKTQTTKAPTPMTPAKGTATGTKDYSQMTDAEFNAARRAQVRKYKPSYT